MIDLKKHITWQIEEITYEEIYPIWADKLWPGRPRIKPWSAMINATEYSMQIKRYAESNFGLYGGKFFGIKTTDTGQVIAINSGHQCSKTLFRSRGLFVYPEFTRRGMAQSLLAHTALFAQENGFEKIWSYPHEKAMKIYETVGYTCGEPHEHQSYKNQDRVDVFRVNAYAELQLI